MYCTKCGAYNDDSARFCKKCGAVAADEYPEISQQQIHQSPVYRELSYQPVPAPAIINAKVPKKHTGLKVISALTVIAIICTALFFVFQKSDEEQIEALFNNFAESYNSGDFDGVTNCFEPRAQQALKSLMSLGSSAAGVDIGSVFGLAYAANDEQLKFEISEIKFTNDEKTKAKVTAVLYCGESDEGENTVKVIKIKNKWYIAMDELF